MKTSSILALVSLVSLAFTSCGKSEAEKTAEANQKATEARNKEALESLKLIEERDARTKELTEKMKNAPLPK